MLIGNKIFELRKNMKLSQEELAEKINVSRQTVSNWETDQTVPDLYQAKELANILNISIDELVGNKVYEDILKDSSLLWSRVKNKLKDNISELSYKIWFEDIKEAEIKKDELILYCSTELICMHINNNYVDDILNIVKEVCSNKIKKVIAIVETKK